MKQSASRKFILCEIFSHPGVTVVLIASVSNKRVHPSVKHEDFTISKILNLSKINCQKSWFQPICHGVTWAHPYRSNCTRRYRAGARKWFVQFFCLRLQTPLGPVNNRSSALCPITSGTRLRFGMDIPPPRQRTRNAPAHVNLNN